MSRCRGPHPKESRGSCLRSPRRNNRSMLFSWCCPCFRVMALDSFPRSSVGTHTGTLPRPVKLGTTPVLRSHYSARMRCRKRLRKTWFLETGCGSVGKSHECVSASASARCGSMARDAGASLRRSHAGAWERDSNLVRCFPVFPATLFGVRKRLSPMGLAWAARKMVGWNPG